MTQAEAQIQAIVFDFGGVLMDWNPRYLYRQIFPDDATIDNFLTEIGFSAWNLEQDRGRAFAEAVEELAAKFPHYREHIQAYEHRWIETISGSIPGTVEILAALKAKGYPLYGLSNWSAETFYKVYDEYEFFKWFEVIVLSGEEKLVKPEPEIYNVLLEKIGLKAENCVFIDDSLPNIETSKRLGFTGIRFESPEQLAAELKQLNVLP